MPDYQPPYTLTLLLSQWQPLFALLPVESLVHQHLEPQVTPQVAALLAVITGEVSREDLQAALGLKDRKSFQQRYIQPALEAGLIEMTVPEKPRSRLQKYRLTARGKATVAG